MNLKNFSARLHHGLDQIDFPTKTDERVEAFAKLLKLPRFKAECILNGTCPPDSQLLARIAEELDVETDWLLGESRA